MISHLMSKNEYLERENAAMKKHLNYEEGFPSIDN